MDTGTKLTIEDAVDIGGREVRIVGQEFIDCLLDLGKPGGCIFKLQQLTDADKLASLEDGLVLVINNGITVWTVFLAEEHQADAELLLHFCCQLSFSRSPY